MLHQSRRDLSSSNSSAKSTYHSGRKSLRRFSLIWNWTYFWGIKSLARHEGAGPNQDDDSLINRAQPGNARSVSRADLFPLCSEIQSSIPRKWVGVCCCQKGRKFLKKSAWPKKEGTSVFVDRLLFWPRTTSMGQTGTEATRHWRPGRWTDQLDGISCDQVWLLYSLLILTPTYAPAAVCILLLCLHEEQSTRLRKYHPFTDSAADIEMDDQCAVCSSQTPSNSHNSTGNFARKRSCTSKHDKIKNTIRRFSKHVRSFLVVPHGIARSAQTPFGLLSLVLGANSEQIWLFMSPIWQLGRRIKFKAVLNQCTSSRTSFLRTETESFVLKLAASMFSFNSPLLPTERRRITGGARTPAEIYNCSVFRSAILGGAWVASTVRRVCEEHDL